MSKIKEVETHTCRSYSFWIQKMRHKLMEKLLPFASDNQRKTSSFVLLVFYSQPSSYSLYFLSFFIFFSPHSVFFLLSLFTPLLCFPFSSLSFPVQWRFSQSKGWKKNSSCSPLFFVFFSPLSFSSFFVFLLSIAYLSLIPPY